MTSSDSYVRSIYILCPGKLALSKHVETYIRMKQETFQKILNFDTAVQAYFLTENVKSNIFVEFPFYFFV